LEWKVSTCYNYRDMYRCVSSNDVISCLSRCAILHLLLLLLLMLMLMMLIDSLLTLELFGLFGLTHVTLDAVREHCASLRTFNVGQCWKVSPTSS